MILRRTRFARQGDSSDTDDESVNVEARNLILTNQYRPNRANHLVYLNLESGTADRHLT